MSQNIEYIGYIVVTLKLWLMFEHLLVYRVKTFDQQVNLVNVTLKSSIYKQFILPFLSRDNSGTAHFIAFKLKANVVFCIN